MRALGQGQDALMTYEVSKGQVILFKNKKRKAESHKPQKTKVVRSPTYLLFLIKLKEGLRWCFWAFTMKESNK
jgi:hypothetical protein